MKSSTKLIIISKSKFCFVPELYSNEQTFKKLNSFSEQQRFEMTNQTNLSESAKEQLNRGVNLSEEIEREIWRKILNGIENTKTNILDLGSSNRLELFAEQIKGNRNDYQLKCINLELSEPEFTKRCESTLKKGKKLSSESILSFLDKYKNQEINRQRQLVNIKQNIGIEFMRYRAEIYEKKIVNEQMSNSL